MPCVAFTPADSLPVPHITVQQGPATQIEEDCRQTDAATETASLVEAARVALNATGYPRLREVEVEDCKGVIVLWGRVTSYYQKQLAQEKVQQVAGVRRVANGLEVSCGQPSASPLDTNECL